MRNLEILFGTSLKRNFEPKVMQIQDQAYRKALYFPWSNRGRMITFVDYRVEIKELVQVMRSRSV